MVSAEELMRLAIAKAHDGIVQGQSPFGCAIAWHDRVIAVCHNVVWATTDCTAHAEVTAIREACRATQSVLLEGAIVATTCEPCPMCMAALHWARVDQVYFGGTIADAARAGFNELRVPATELIRQGGSSIRLFPDLLRAECVALFDEWRRTAPKPY